MKRFVIVGFTLLFFFNSYSVGQDNYNKMIDFVLITIGGLISSDLLNDSILIFDNSWKGESFVLEVVFDAKSTFIIRMLGSDSLRKKFYNQGGLFNLRRWKFDEFRKFINEHQTFPYHSFDHFKYRFLLISKNEKLLGEAIYGEYKFKATDKEISIMDRKVETLQGEDAIKQRYNSNF